MIDRASITMVASLVSFMLIAWITVNGYKHNEDRLNAISEENHTINKTMQKAIDQARKALETSEPMINKTIALHKLGLDKRV